MSRSDPPSPLRQRLGELERQFATEQAQHERSHQELHRAQRALAELQAHAQRVALRCEDELANERQATIRAQRELDDLLFERERYKQVVPPITHQTAPGPELAQASVPKLPASPNKSGDSARKPRGQPPPQTAPDPKPVRWWTASHRAKSKAKSKR